ncbi:MAG TPA: TadA family conjugal transfer-associated ATPase [Mycobacteriales bacterium]|nr:TadA family conjugal transfer-associated ATPase [Mycobacteriales bacterium]
MTGVEANEPELLGRVRRRLASSADRFDPTTLAAAVRDEAPTAGLSTLLDITGTLGSELQGAGPLAPLLAEPGVTDVLVNGPGPVWVDRGDGPRPSGLEIHDEDTARRLAVRLVAAGGRRLDDAAPYADARLADGVRVHAVIPPLAPEGTCISLRVPPRRVFTLAQLVDAGSLPVDGAEMLRRLIAARLAFLVTGGTGTGKTTVLSSLLSLSDPVERLVLVEDAAELRPAHPHVVRLESRPANSEGVGAVSLDVLVRQSLRMRPDRLVVGEVRGGEVLDLLAALNTGHEGGCSTVHANRAEHLPARIESLCGQAGVPRAAAHSLLVAAVDVVLHLSRGADGRRRMAGLSVLVASPDGLATVVPAYRFTPDGVVAATAADVLDDRLGRR